MIWSWSLDFLAKSDDWELTVTVFPKKGLGFTMNSSSENKPWYWNNTRSFPSPLGSTFCWHFGCGFETFHVPGLVICYSSRTGKWPIEIVDLPNLKKVIFQFAMLVYQRVWVNLFWAPQPIDVDLSGAGCILIKVVTSNSSNSCRRIRGGLWRCSFSDRGWHCHRELFFKYGTAKKNVTLRPGWWRLEPWNF